MCCGVCEPALSRMRSSLMFCSATTHVSSFAATASRRLDDVGDRAALALEMRESPHALVAAALVERIRGALEPRDLRLERSAPLAGDAALEIRQREREHLHLLGERVRRAADVRNARALGGRHPLEQSQHLVAIGFGLANAIAVGAGDAHDVVARRACRADAAASVDDRACGRVARDAARASPGAGRDRTCARTYVSASSATSIRSRSRGWRNTSRQS